MCCCRCVIFRVQNFRLHPNESHVNQSFEVHQINRMFNTGAIISNNNNKNVVNTVSNGNGNLVNSPRKSTRNEHRRRHHHHHHHHHRIREVPEMSNICANNLKIDNNCLDKNSNRHSITIMDAEPTHRFENGNL